MNEREWLSFVASTNFEPEALAIAITADFVCGKKDRLILSLPKWHAQSKTATGEAQLLRLLKRWGINRLEVEVAHG